MRTKTNEIRTYLEMFDIILLVETFVEKKHQVQTEKLLPRNFKWHWTAATRDLTRGRPWGGELIGVRKELKTANFWDNQRLCCSGIDISINNSTFNIYNIYNRNGVKEIKDLISDKIENNLINKTIILGDWNAKIGPMGSRRDDNSDDSERSTKDPEVNSEGEELMDFLIESGLSILNGNKPGDWSGEITHVGYRSKSVIDFGAANEEAWNEIVHFKIGDNPQSDHFPIELTLSTPLVKKDTENLTLLPNLREDNKEQYRTCLERSGAGNMSSWNDIANCMRKAMPKKKVRKRKTPDVWWNEACYIARQAVKQEYKRAKVSNDFEGYRVARKDYKQIVRESKKAAQERRKEELRKVSNIRDGWKYIEKYRRGQERKPSMPEDHEITNHFVSLLNGRPERPEDASPSGPHPLEHDPAEITIIDVVDFNRILNSMKNGKAVGLDELNAEALKYADCKTKATILKMMQAHLNGQPIPAEWRNARIHPLYKKGPPEEAENYRGITIVNAVYKLYALIICSLLATYVETENLLPDTQNGFRKGRSTIDSIYIVNHLLQASIADGKHLYAAFIDYKAAFDLINRAKLFKKLEKLGIPVYLVNAIKEIYRSTPYTINGTKFFTDTGLKQGCPLSPLLFALYISDMEQVLRKWQSGGVIVGRTKVFMMAYADDIVIFAHTPGELKDMLKCLHKYSANRDMVISTDKSKVMRFSRGGQKSKNTWTCGSGCLKEVKRFVYLGYVFQSSGSFKGQIDTMARNGGKRVSAVWSMAEHMWPENFQVRMQMYKSLVEPCLLYGSELFGFYDLTSIDRVQRRYLRWTLGLAPWTRTCLLMTETDTLPASLICGKRAMDYEMRCRESACLLLRECIKEVQEGRIKTSFTKARGVFLNTAGFGASWIRQQSESRAGVERVVYERRRDQFVQLRECACNGTDYKNIRPRNGTPIYLCSGGDFKTVARFRMQNEDLNSQKWRKNKLCRICRKVNESVEHMLDCVGETAVTSNVFLAEDGSGRDIMERILERRKQCQT